MRAAADRRRPPSGGQFYSLVRIQQPLRFVLQPRTRSTFGSSSNPGSQLGCRVGRQFSSCAIGHLYRCGPRCTQTSTPCAPRSRDIALPNLSLSTFAKLLSAGPYIGHGARWCKKLAGIALLIPQAGARSPALAPNPPRCAAVATRLCYSRTLLSRVLLHASQDRSRVILRVCLRSCRLWIPRARATHDYVRLVAPV